MKYGRPPIDKARRTRNERRAVLHKGMLICYEVIDTARKELAELDAADSAGIAAIPSSSNDQSKDQPGVCIAGPDATLEEVMDTVAAAHAAGVPSSTGERT